MAFPLSLEPGSPLRSHASLRVVHEPPRAVTNRYYGVTNLNALRSPPRSVECDAITRLSHGDNVTRVSRIVFKLSTELGDVCVNGAAHHLGVVSPDVPEHIDARNNVPASPKERHQQLELLRPEADRESAPIDGVRTRTHFDLSEADALA